jgi:glycogen(starch) synthase
MHILLCSRHYPPETGRGGLGTYTQHLARALSDMGHQVMVVSSSAAATVEERDGRVRVFRFEYRWKRQHFFPKTRNALRYAWGVEREIQRVLSDRPVDIVHFPDLLGEGFFYSLRGGRPPFVVRSAMRLLDIEAVNRQAWPSGPLDRLDHRITAWLERFPLRRAASHIAPSHYAAEELARREPSLVPAHVIYNGTDLEQFRPRDRSSAREASGIPKDAVVFLYAGPLEFRKGVQLLPAAFRQVATEIPEAMLVIAGTDHLTAPGSGSMRRWLEIRFETEGLDERVLFLGTVSLERMPEIYAVADVLVAPTYPESLGNVFIESLAMGLPILTTAHGGQTEVVDDGRTGFLIAPGDAQALAGAMRDVVADQHALERAAAEARREALARFDRKLMAQRTLSVYRKVVQALSPESDAALEATAIKGPLEEEPAPPPTGRRI